MSTPTIERPTNLLAADSRPQKPGAERARVQRMSIRRILTRPVRHVLLAVIVVIIGGLVGVLPFATRSLQDETYAQSRERLDQLQRENAALTAQRDLLKTDEEVARLAREEFGLAPSDATVYAIPELRPDNEDRDRSGAAAAPSVAKAPKRSLGNRIIDFVVFWD